MSEEDRVDDMRYEYGRDAAIAGEALHEGASEEFERGYRSYRGFGSNVSPRKFGKGGQVPKEWTCTCGNVNSARIRRKVGGREVCWQCGIERALAQKAQT
jgi:hypothetical protein